MATVVCHFFNEEYLLPWWLKHHRKIFEHGIMIDYHSTDSSREIIRELCPSWEIVTTRNAYFDSAVIDREVEDYEAGVSGWRMALNVTEFLYGNLAYWSEQDPQQRFVGNYVFVDSGQGLDPDPARPLHEQITWGYFEDGNPCARLAQGFRTSRSLHNYPQKYHPLGGRHWPNPPSQLDLAIFYYGYAMTTPQSLARKLQIQTKMGPEERARCGNNHPNTLNQNQLLATIDQHHRPRCRDLAEEIKTIIGYNYD